LIWIVFFVVASMVMPSVAPTTTSTVFLHPHAELRAVSYATKTVQAHPNPTTYDLKRTVANVRGVAITFGLKHYTDPHLIQYQMWSYGAWVKTCVLVTSPRPLAALCP
jgi:hypothetical protein